MKTLAALLALALARPAWAGPQLSLEPVRAPVDAAAPQAAVLPALAPAAALPDSPPAPSAAESSPEAATSEAAAPEAARDAALFDGADPYERFAAWETVNDVYDRIQSASRVSADYRPAPGRRFVAKVLHIPVEDLHVVDYGAGDAAARARVYVEKDGRRHFRFVVHPDSEELYDGLIERYGVAETIEVSPTASTRTGLLRETDGTAPVQGKLTLDKLQSGLGRAIPDWEVRRSVAISKLAESIPEADSRAYGVSIIPEIAGAYVDKSLGLGSYVDPEQRTVFQHGMIYRSSAFLTSRPDLDLYPGFALLSARGEKPPLLVEWWRREHERTGVSFDDFLDEALIAPVARAVGYLVFAQGLIPDAHLQNMVLGVDPATGRVAHVFFRDVGSMKVDLLLRWSRGLPVDALRSRSPVYDFKFPWAADIAGHPLLKWFHRWSFSDDVGHGPALKSSVPEFDSDRALTLIERRLAAEIERHMPGTLAGADRLLFTASSVSWAVRSYVDDHPPTLVAEPGHDSGVVAAFVERQERFGQTMALPDTWFPDLREPTVTAYGVVYPSSSGRRLALLPPEGVSAQPRSTPTRWEADVPVSQLVDAGRLRAWAALPDAKLPARLRGDGRLQVLRLTDGDDPRYVIVGRVRQALQEMTEGARTLAVDVLHDLADLSGPVRRDLLRYFKDGFLPKRPQ